MDTLEDKFNTEEGCYSGYGEVDVERDGVSAQGELGFVGAGQDVRSFTRVYREGQTDRSVVIFPGLGETSAQFNGDFLTVLMKVLGDSLDNTDILAVDTVGRAVNVEVYGGTLKGRVKDAQSTVAALDEAGKLAKEIVIIAHSAGFLDALAVMRNVGSRVSDVIALNPVVDVGKWELGFLAPKFVWLVKKYLVSTFLNVLKNKGGVIQLQEQDHNRIMFSGDENGDHYVRGFDDSSRVFWDMCMKHGRWFDDLFEEGGAAKDTNFHIMRGRYDKAIPFKTIENWMKSIKGKVNVTLENVPDFEHSIPYTMSDFKKDTMGLYLKKVLPGV
ncbi:alpha/beta hydrolase [Candidatus Gracilibacteria bacterium]|nr:alpha/beta hydrolase [Candidatus Gracilibacteria bacterium]